MYQCSCLAQPNHHIVLRHAVCHHDDDALPLWHLPRLHRPDVKLLGWRAYGPHAAAADDNNAGASQRGVHGDRRGLLQPRLRQLRDVHRSG